MSEMNDINRRSLTFTCQACGRIFHHEINEIRLMTNENVCSMPSQFCSYSCELHGWDPQAVRLAMSRRKQMKPYVSGM